MKRISKKTTSLWIIGILATVALGWWLYVGLHVEPAVFPEHVPLTGLQEF